MAINNVAMKAYSSALDMSQEMARAQRAGKSSKIATADLGVNNAGGGFGDMISDSVKKVNDMQTEKKTMVESFASGEEQNVHELMITLQKAGLAMSMTSAVRNKVMEAYKEVMHMQF